MKCWVYFILFNLVLQGISAVQYYFDTKTIPNHSAWLSHLPFSNHTEKIEKYVYFSASQLRKIIDWRRKKSKLKLAWW